MHKYSNTIFLSLIFLFIVLFAGILLPKEEWLGCFIFITLCVIINSIPMVISILNEKQMVGKKLHNIVKQHGAKYSFIKTNKNSLMLKINNNTQEYKEFLKELKNLDNIVKGNIWLKNGDRIDIANNTIKIFKYGNSNNS